MNRTSIPMALERYDQADTTQRDIQLELQARRDDWAARLRVVAALLLVTCAGLGLMGYALHTTDPAIGGIAWIAGQTVWLGGWLFVIVGAYGRQARRRGR